MAQLLELRGPPSSSLPLRPRVRSEASAGQQAAAAGERQRTSPPNAGMVQRALAGRQRGPTTPAAASPTGSAADCPGHERGEVATSRTAAGHLATDVREEVGGALVVADFPVGGHRLKAATAAERGFQEWRARFETNSAYRLKLFGFSDCVGSRERNVELRSRRAQAVHDELLPDSQRRVVAKGPFNPELFLVDNRTIEHRALNRGVLVAFEQQHEGEVIEGEGDLVERVVDQSLQSLSTSPYDQEFLRCWLEGLRTPGFDELYVDGFRWSLHTQELDPPSAFDTLLTRRSRRELQAVGILRDLEEELIGNVVPGEDPKRTYRYLRGMANRYHRAVDVAARIASKYSIGGGSAINPGDRQLIDFLGSSADRPSIHRCYLDFYSGG